MQKYIMNFLFICFILSSFVYGFNKSDSCYLVIGKNSINNNIDTLLIINYSEAVRKGYMYNYYALVNNVYMAGYVYFSRSQIEDIIIGIKDELVLIISKSRPVDNKMQDSQSFVVKYYQVTIKKKEFNIN